MKNPIITILLILTVGLAACNKNITAIMPDEDNTAKTDSTFSGNIIFICGDKGTCSALDAKNGHKLWSFTSEASIVSSPTYANGNIYFGTLENKIVALELKTGKKQWEKVLSNNIISSPTIYDNNLYVGLGDVWQHDKIDGEIYSLNALNGKTNWSISLPKYRDSSPTIFNNSLYVLSGNGLQILDTKTGSIMKTHSLSSYNNLRIRNFNNIKGIGNIIFSSPCVFDNKVCYNFSENEYNTSSFVSYDLKTNNIKWTYPLKSFSASSPTVSNNVAFIMDAKNLYALNLSTSKLKWEYQMPQNSNYQYGNSLVSPIINNKMLYTVHQFEIFAFNEESGKKIWSFSDGFTSSPVLFDSMVYVASPQKVTALNDLSGKVVWSHPLESWGLGITSSPLVIDAKGNSYHAGISGNMQ